MVSFFFVPETRGMDLEQLENIYREKKPQVFEIKVYICSVQFNELRNVVLITLHFNLSFYIPQQASPDVSESLLSAE